MIRLDDDVYLSKRSVAEVRGLTFGSRCWNGCGRGCRASTELRFLPNRHRLKEMSISECGCCLGIPAEGLRRGVHLTRGDEWTRGSLRNDALARRSGGVEPIDAGWERAVFVPTAPDLGAGG